MHCCLRPPRTAFNVHFSGGAPKSFANVVGRHQLLLTNRLFSTLVWRSGAVHMKTVLPYAVPRLVCIVSYKYTQNSAATATAGRASPPSLFAFSVLELPWLISDPKCAYQPNSNLLEALVWIPLLWNFVFTFNYHILLYVFTMRCEIGA